MIKRIREKKVNLQKEKLLNFIHVEMEQEYR